MKEKADRVKRKMGGKGKKMKSKNEMQSKRNLKEKESQRKKGRKINPQINKIRRGFLLYEGSINIKLR